MSLTTLNNTDEKILNDIFNNIITVFEDIQGSKIFISYNGTDFEFRTKSYKNDPLNILDLSLQKYYNKAINFFYSLDSRVLSLIPKNWFFCFEYFPDEQPAHISYESTPKNNLILTGIVKNGKFKYSIDELIEYANLLNCDYLPIVFHGKLNSKQKENIKYFLNTSEEDLKYIFGENNFALFFYKLLDPTHENSFLMKKGNFQKNLRRLIIRTNKETEYGFQILNPLYEKSVRKTDSKYTEVYTLILVNFLDYCQTLDLNNIKISGNKKEESYLDLICRLYNMYMNDTSEDLKDFDFEIPKFFQKKKFEINTKLIKNKLTKKYVNTSPKFEYIFKCLLGSLNKTKKHPIGVFSDQNLELYNSFVKEINDRIELHLNRIREDDLRKNQLMDFDKFDFKYGSDGEGNTYPDVYKEFEPEVGEDKKKKKIGIFKK